MSSVEQCAHTDIHNLGMIIGPFSNLTDCMNISRGRGNEIKTNNKEEQQPFIGIIQYTNALNSVLIQVITNTVQKAVGIA